MHYDRRIRRQRWPMSHPLIEVFRLAECFRQYFEAVPATTPEQKRAAYRIRHAVYCTEFGWLEKSPSGHEEDEYDADALHLLIRTRHDGEFVGCIRIVRPVHSNTDYPLPFEKACRQTLWPDRLAFDQVPRDRIGEVSRLAVVARYRRRRGEQEAPVVIHDDHFGGDKMPRFPYIPVGLYLGMVAVAELNGIERLFLLTDERLTLHFRRLGLNLVQIGPAIDHHGIRIPSMMDVEAVVAGFNRLTRPLYRHIHQETAEALGVHNAQRAPATVCPPAAAARVPAEIPLR